MARGEHRRHRAERGLEAVANVPTTAHLLGGAVIGRDREPGVIDRHNRVFGYETCWCATAPRCRRIRA